MLKRTGVRLPPTYRDAEVCAQAPTDAGVVAYALDARGRVQTLYSSERVGERQEDRETQLLRTMDAVREGLARIERDVGRALRSPEPLGPPQLLGMVVLLMEHAGIRLGKDDYLKDNGTHGASNLQCRHLRGSGRSSRRGSGRLVLEFRGKSGVMNVKEIDDPLLLAGLGRLVSERCQSESSESDDRREVRIFGRGGWDVTHKKVQRFVRETFGPGVTAKLIRTRTSNVALLDAYAGASDSLTPARRTREAIRVAAERLHHNSATATKSYLHRGLVEALASSSADASTKISSAATPEDAIRALLGAPETRPVETRRGAAVNSSRRRCAAPGRGSASLAGGPSGLS